MIIVEDFEDPLELVLQHRLPYLYGSVALLLALIEAVSRQFRACDTTCALNKTFSLKEITASWFANDVGARPVAFNCAVGLAIIHLPKSSLKPHTPSELCSDPLRKRFAGFDIEQI